MSRDRSYAAFLLLAAICLAVFLFKSYHKPYGEKTTRQPNNPPQNDASIKSGAAPAKSPLPEAVPSEAPRPAAKKAASHQKAFSGLPLDINAATADELMMLPGIGPKTAERIIEKRRELGGFKTTDDLLEVKGIGPVKFEKVRRMVFAGPVNKEK